MLKPIDHLIKNPNDLPDIPRQLRDYLESRFNASYLYQVVIPNLRKAGHTEEFISGVLQGHHMAQQVLDEIEVRKQLLKEE